MPTPQKSNQQPEAENKEKPVFGPVALKTTINTGTVEDPQFKDVIALWQDPRHADRLTGFVDIEGTKHQVNGFINANKETGAKFIALKEKVGDEYKTILFGHPINEHKNGTEVHFDTVAFSGEASKDTIFARVRSGMSAEMHSTVGFKEPMTERGAYVKPEPEPEAAGCTP